MIFVIICRNKWHPGTLEISTPPETAAGANFYVQHGTTTIPTFLPADEEASWLLLPSLMSLLSGGTVQPENTYSCILKMAGQVWESQKRISINTATISVHLFKPVSTDLTIKSNSVFYKPNRKIWGARLVNLIKHLPLKVFLLCAITRRVANQG